MADSEILDLIFDNVKKVIFPEEWIEIDLTLSKHELFTLMLVERKGEITMSQIAAYVNVSMSTATGIVDRLVKNGFLVRNRTETDRRIVIISLTEKAKKLVAEIQGIATRYITLIGESLSDEEKKFLFGIFTKIIGVLNMKRDEIAPKEEKAAINRITIE
ncbi:MAG: MarR family transcriptional regulator [Chitinispirillaceae bacterium]|nr:MarR family transcriptional regulator [Chitinispirillaceae bacterium]